MQKQGLRFLTMNVSKEASQCVDHMFAADALFICCHKNSQQAIVENFNIHILMLFTYMQMLRTEISNACTKGGSKIHEPD